MRKKRPKQFDSFELTDGPEDAWDLMQQRINEGRKERMRKVVSERSDYIRVCMQDVHDPHNIGACLRSAEALGIQNVDFVNFYQKFMRPSKVSRGAFQWMDLLRFRDFDLYTKGIRERGYKIAAAYPTGTNYSLDELPIDQPLVVVLGNEKQGVDARWDEHVDYRFTIPMHGFVESYNISVSAAITLYSLSQRCRKELPANRYFIDEAGQKRLLNRWMIRQSRALEKELKRMRAQELAADLPQPP